jgi:glutamyl-tRNA synthetase
MYDNKYLANLIFPDVTETLDDLEKRYPERNLPEGAEVTRFAPSPTGFLHTGSLFTSLVAQKVAVQGGGVFYTRLEDTDTKREIAGSGEDLIRQLAVFGVVPSEGYLGDHQEGNYGPYIQSERADIYKVAIKHLIEIGRAYPCFCTKEELDEIRNRQEKMKVVPGYYGRFAKYRNLTVDEYVELINSGKPYVIRFRSLGDHNLKVEADDLVRGHLLLTQNDQDIVIYKSDGLPTYHFAHLVDDHFMRTTIVTRGEEWLPSLPTHLELFEAMGWKAPKYAHLPVIMKMDNGIRRKLSKRKDTEASCAYFLQDGYPVYAFKQYLFTIANSNFEEWQIANPTLTIDDFHFSFDNMSRDGALFDIGKLNFFSKEFLAKKTAVEMTEFVKDYASKYNQELLDLINKDEAYFTKVMDIEKDKPNPRKDYEKCADILDKVKFMYEPYYSTLMKGELPWSTTLDHEVMKATLKDFGDTVELNLTEQEWFETLKQCGLRHGFAASKKEYKAEPEKYLGSVNDVAEMVRIALTSSKNSPNIYYVLRILGKDEIVRRMNIACETL